MNGTQFSFTEVTDPYNTSIAAHIDFGVFGRHILSKYCGSAITAQFYNPSHNIQTNLLATEDVDQYAMLLTEEQMGRIAMENVVIFIAFTFLSITIQSIFALYFKSCKNSCDNYYLRQEIENQNGDQPSEERAKCCESFVDSKTARNTDYCFKGCMSILALLVLAHLFVSMREYYIFVGRTVQYDDLLHNYSYDSTLESCDAEGIGRIACPALFCKYDEDGEKQCSRIWTDYEDGYTADEAEEICSWVFYMLIIANPTVYQYSLLASLVAVDGIAYLLIFVIVSICPALWCTCCSWFLCCCGCCLDCHSCCPQPKSCCHINFCCREATCCYFCCGAFGPCWWIINFVVTLVLMVILLGLVGVSFAIAAVMTSLLSLICVYIVSFPLCPVLGCKLYCQAVAGVFMGKRRDAFAITTKTTTEDPNIGGIELKVRTSRSKSSDSQMKKTQSIFTILRKCRFQELKSAEDLKKASSIISILTPLLLIYAIALVQSFVSIFIIYFVVDGQVFMAWNYYKPIVLGLVDYFISAYDLITDPIELWLYIQDITLYISWKSLFAFSLEYFSSFKVTVLLLRSILHVFIGILEASISLS